MRPLSVWIVTTQPEVVSVAASMARGNHPIEVSERHVSAPVVASTCNGRTW